MKRQFLVGIWVVAIGVLLIVLFGQTSTGDRTISVDEAHEMIRSDSSIVILDVRTPAEYASETGHLANALLIPVQELEERISELEPFKDRTIIAYCRTGNRSGRAAALLHKHDFKALNMDGGITVWNQEHLPVVKEVKEEEK